MFYIQYGWLSSCSYFEIPRRCWPGAAEADGQVEPPLWSHLTDYSDITQHLVLLSARALSSFGFYDCVYCFVMWRLIIVLKYAIQLSVAVIIDSASPMLYLKHVTPCGFTLQRFLQCFSPYDTRLLKHWRKSNANGAFQRFSLDDILAHGSWFNVTVRLVQQDWERLPPRLPANAPVGGKLAPGAEQQWGTGGWWQQQHGR